MKVFRRLVASVVLMAVVAPVSQVSAAPKPNDRCPKAGRERVTAAGTLRCQSVGGVLRWRLAEGASGGYKVGDIGPGGGIVFYVAPSTFASPGSDCASSCRNLEAAPAPSGGDPWRVWAAEVNLFKSVPTGTGIGSGMANTIASLKQGGNSGTAAEYAFGYVNGGKRDWHLPSRDELDKLFKRRDGVGGFALDNYWSSSGTSRPAAWSQDFVIRYQSNVIKTYSFRVRPVRAF